MLGTTVFTQRGLIKLKETFEQLTEVHVFSSFGLVLKGFLLVVLRKSREHLLLNVCELTGSGTVWRGPSCVKDCMLLILQRVFVAFVSLCLCVCV